MGKICPVQEFDVFEILGPKIANMEYNLGMKSVKSILRTPETCSADAHEDTAYIPSSKLPFTC